MFILGKALNGVYYYLMTNGKDRPFMRTGRRCFWTRKRNKAYQFESLEAAVALGKDFLQHCGGVSSSKFYEDTNEMRHLYYGRSRYNWGVFKWLTGLAGAGTVFVSMFYSNLDNNDEHVNTTFASVMMSTADYLPLVTSPHRARYKAAKLERNRLLAEAFAEARANGVLPSTTKKQPKWTVLYNIVTPGTDWIGTGWEFFDDEVAADECYRQAGIAGNVATKRPYNHACDWKHLGAAHRM